MKCKKTKCMIDNIKCKGHENQAAVEFNYFGNILTNKSNRNLKTQRDKSIAFQRMGKLRKCP